MSMVSAESSFFDIRREHVHLVIAGAQIQLGEIFSIAQFLQQFINNRNEKFIFGGLGIQFPVIHT